MKQNKAYIIGVTGGIGSGKSYVLDYLNNQYNALIIKADDIGNDVKLRGRECYDDIVSLLGEDILGDDLEIDKKIMAEKIFSDSSLKEKVNAVIHPAVKKCIKNSIAFNNEKYRYILIEAALLCEDNYFDILNELWEIRSDIDIRIKRLMDSRFYSLDKCKKIIANQNDSSYIQMKNDDYMKSTDREDYYGLTVIDNNSDFDSLKKNLDEVMEVIDERIGN